MGFFKKIFKPVAKVLDKVVPNEIKPALPFAAAFAPFIAPSLYGSAASGLGSLLRIGATGGGAFLGGGLNIFLKGIVSHHIINIKASSQSL